ncbi:MAG: biotin--[acetyl-CoA-carboxylase] ligase [Thermoguttaceae bacterium]|nr:biotin--[acetyl-CoA-carboxylase] ligase [Thermoguttaceae bacterium]MDW8039029.1 biotin--[acetyl-CoA-carboxylase] ligase [Thermoguttaceae bacterium]
MNRHFFQRLISQSFVRYVEHHALIDSTNNRARRLALGEEAFWDYSASAPKALQECLPGLILADQQSAGRGRGSNRWWTGPGSLAMSLLLPPVHQWSRIFRSATANSPDVAQRAASEKNLAAFCFTNSADREISTGLVGLATALAVVRTVRPRLPGVEVGIHWPNDVFADGKKLAGILVEVLSTGLVIVGIGVNTNNTAHQAPEELRLRLTTLRDLTGQGHPHDRFLPELLNSLENVFSRLVSIPDRLAAEVHRWCLQRGRSLKVRTPGGDTEGICEGIGPQGELVLNTPTGVRRIFSGCILG